MGSIHLGGHGSYRGAHQRHSGRRADEVLTFFFSGLVMAGYREVKGERKEQSDPVMLAKRDKVSVMEVSIV